MKKLIKNQIFGSNSTVHFVYDGIDSIEEICSSIIKRTIDLRDNEKQKLVKKFAFNELLKALSELGLSYRSNSYDKVYFFKNYILINFFRIKKKFFIYSRSQNQISMKMKNL